MSDRSPADHGEVTRVQRVLEEALDRYAGGDESERAEAVVRTLWAEVTALPSASRAPLLAALAAFYPEPAEALGSTRPHDGQAQRHLEQENERLRETLAAAQAKAAAVAVATEAGAFEGAFAAAIGKLLVGSARRGAGATGADAEQRTLGILRAVVEFVSQLAAGYLAVGLEPDVTMTTHFHAAIADEIEGKRPAGSVKRLLGQIRQQIGSQVIAFRKACETGSSELLSQLDPESIATEAGSSRLFHYQKRWETLLRRYDELRMADNLYELYFDVAFQRVMRELLKGLARTGDAA